MAQAPGKTRKYRSDDEQHVITYGRLCQMSIDVTGGIAPTGWSFDWADDRQSVLVSWDGETVETYRLMPVGW